MLMPMRSRIRRSGGQVGIGLVQGLLDRHRAVHGIDDAGELGQDTVAGRARDLAPVRR